MNISLKTFLISVNFLQQWDYSFSSIQLQKINKYGQIHHNHEIFEKTRFINDIKFISFKRKPVNTLNYASMKKVCLPFIFYQ